jgi:hypothetical protein
MMEVITENELETLETLMKALIETDDDFRVFGEIFSEDE